MTLILVFKKPLYYQGSFTILSSFSGVLKMENDQQKTPGFYRSAKR